MGDDLSLPSRLLRVPAYLMLEIIKEMRAQGVARAPEAKWRLPGFAVMAALEEFGPASQSEVSRRLRFDPSDLVAIIDALEDAGWVIRGRDERDRRRHELRLTDAGREALEERFALADRYLGETFGALDEDERELLISMLQRVLAHLDPTRVPP
jgi:DNA-binding MarR family transcriptional regulator